jgi:uncharacterized protein YndB with AHSA1/START domain
MTLTAHSVSVSRTLQADPDLLFRAWTDPAELRHWWSQAGEGWAFAGASVDLRVGGRYRLAMTGPDGRTHAATGVYREVERPTRLVFTWDWEDPASRIGETVVTVEFRDLGAVGTEVLISHDRFPDAARLGRHRQGWSELLQLLERHVG